jgi:hypothetical protein
MMGMIGLDWIGLDWILGENGVAEVGSEERLG